MHGLQNPIDFNGYSCIGNRLFYDMLCYRTFMKYLDLKCGHIYTLNYPQVDYPLGLLPTTYFKLKLLSLGDSAALGQFLSSIFYAADCKLILIAFANMISRYMLLELLPTQKTCGLCLILDYPCHKCLPVARKIKRPIKNMGSLTCCKYKVS